MMSECYKLDRVQSSYFVFVLSQNYQIQTMFYRTNNF